MDSGIPPPPPLLLLLLVEEEFDNEFEFDNNGKNNDFYCEEFRFSGFDK